jgi:hypothetical protein
MRIRIIVLILLACFMIIMPSCISNTSADDSWAKPAEGKVQEDDTAAEPLNESDFILTYYIETMDAIKFLKEYGSGQLIFFDDPPIVENKEDVITTARGIHLGDTREDFEKVYGKDYVFHEGLDSYFSEYFEESGIPWDDTVSHIHYFTDMKAGLTFCFDNNNEVSFIIYTRPLLAGELE